MTEEVLKEDNPENDVFFDANDYFVEKDFIINEKKKN